MKCLSAKEVYQQYSKIWCQENNRLLVTNLIKAVEATLDQDPYNPALIISYAALLLDRNRSNEALNWLKRHPLPLNEYHQNVAVAYAKTDSVHSELVRKHNQIAANLPHCEFALVAYIDFQAL